MTKQNLPKLLRESKQLSNLLKNLSSEILLFLYDQKCGIYGYNCIIKGPFLKEPNDELRQNFITDEMQTPYFHTFRLNLIESVIYIYIYNLFYILYFKQYLLQSYIK